MDFIPKPARPWRPAAGDCDGGSSRASLALCHRMTPPIPVFIPPPGYSRIKVVQSFAELIATPMVDGVNAICWRRVLRGDFNEIAMKLEVAEGITSIDDEDLRSLSLSESGRMAREVLLADQELLRAEDLQPSLDCIRGDLRDTSGAPVPTDVYSWHADSATVPADTFLCSYNAPASEGLRNEDAIRRVDVPETRALLLSLYGCADDAGFHEFLNEHYYDLHYFPKAGAEHFSFGIGNLWRIATEYPGNPVPPCVHRAPTMQPGQTPRLLLIS